MPDFNKKVYGGALTPLQGDIERGLVRIRSDMNAEALPYTPGESAAPYWDPQPETIGEAFDRIVVWLAAQHPGSVPIT